jgi:ABC-type dipeptide/oligopeptide/nickel transport system ATPase subunit
MPHASSTTMQIDRTLNSLNTLLVESRKRELTALEQLIMAAIWENTPYRQISISSNYEYATIRNASSRLLQDISAALGQTVSKKNCKSVINAHFSQNRSHIDLDDAPTEIQPFWGRNPELTQLTTALQTDRAKLLAIVGSGGMGKTALAARTATTLGDEFDFVIWRSLRESPPLNSLLTEIVQFLSQYTEIDLPATPQRQIQKLLQYLRQHRCLVILDNCESIMEQGVFVGNYRSDYENYGDLFSAIGTTSHQSSVLLTSREVLPEVLELASPQGNVQSLFLQGLEADATQLLQSLGLENTNNELSSLVEQYEGNPLHLRIVANTILHCFNGNINEFQASDQLIYSKMTNVLQSQFDRLTLEEKLVMYHLAVHREPISQSDLGTQLRLPHFVARLPQTLESLQWRALIQTTYQQRYTLQNVLMEFMTAELLQAIAKELNSAEFPFFLISLLSIQPLPPPMSVRYSNAC